MVRPAVPKSPQFGVKLRQGYIAPPRRAVLQPEAPFDLPEVIFSPTLKMTKQRSSNA